MLKSLVVGPDQTLAQPLPVEFATPPVAFDRPAPVAAPQVPRWALCVEAVHASTRSWSAALADAAVLLLAAWTVTAPGHAALFALEGVCALFVSGTYARRHVLQTQGVLWYLTRVLRPFAAVAVLAAGSSSMLHVHPGAVALLAGMALVSLAGLRTLTWLALSCARRHGLALHPTLVVGNGTAAQMVADKLRTFREAGLRPVAVVPLHPSTPHEVARLATESGIDNVVFVPQGSDGRLMTASVKATAGSGVHCVVRPVTADLFLHPGLVPQIGGVPLIPLPAVHQRATQPGKRVLDVLVASACLLAVAPLMAVTALAVKLADRGPVFYRQRRVGRDGRTFEMIKFRSMVVDADRLRAELRDRNVTNGLLFKVEGDPRITRVGAIIRRLSIDELPQLWNVLRGDMSMVGPRPLPVDPDDFGESDNERHRVPPGITGYWQLNGGNGLTYEEMIKLDLAYIHNWSLWLDLRLLLRTIPALLVRHGPC